MAFWPKSFKRILTALLASILILIVSFLALSLWSFRAFTTFIENDPRQ
jgi:LPS O-antigen subunit length determinant protein (WzzB/FepE family)